MEVYEPKSKKYKEEAEKKEERKPVEKVVKNEVTVKKKSYGEKALASLKRDGRDILKDLIVNRAWPGAKDILYDVIVGATGRYIYKDDRDREPRRYGYSSRERSGGRTSYGRYYDDRDREVRDRDRDPDSRRYLRKDVETIILSTRWECEEVFDHMYATLDEYGSVTIADLYQLVGISPSFTDYGYGWKTLSNCGIEKIREGKFELVFSRPISLK